MNRMFPKSKKMGLYAGLVLWLTCISPAYAVFINEIHYDNRGGDTGEGVELAGPAGQGLAGWSLLFYNGGNGQVYQNYALSGTFTDMQQGMGVLAFFISGIQNGASDGVALVDDAGSVLQFLSYEGSLVANAGAAAGLTSIDIGVAESGVSPVGDSLQLLGGGRNFMEFSWGAAPSSFGTINARQLFISSVGRRLLTVSEPGSGALLLFGLLILALMFRAKNNTVLFA